MNFKFTEEEAQYILNCLVKEPYAEVAKLVDSLQSQASEQLNSKPEKE